MVINDPTPEQVPVHDFDFVFADGRRLSVTLWPALGDTIYSDDTRYTFHLPRLKTIQTVWIGPGMALETREGTRVHVTPVDVVKRLRESRQAS